jgi:hypothetical protein
MGPVVVFEMPVFRANREAPVAVALEINFALWVMIACAAIRASLLIYF